MTHAFFDPPVFIREIMKVSVNLRRTPCFALVGHYPVFVESLPTGFKELRATQSQPDFMVGTPYRVSEVLPTQYKPGYGEQTQLKFAADLLTYPCLPATTETAAAFGMVLVEPGQGIHVDSPVLDLDQVDYEYGMFAGHQSPYQGTGQRLLGRVCTDLEHHDFPHVFVSCDPHLPLVISVARYLPAAQTIFLADLWLPRGKALYVPARPKTPSPQVLYLHGNRNAALACWQDVGQDSVRTQTLLQDQGGYFCWYWNELPTHHSLMTDKDLP